MRGKIIKGIAGFYYVHTANDHIYQCKAKGVFRNRNQKPLVGDNVEITILDYESEEGNIDQILPRQNALIRPAVANVDQVLIMFAATQPEPNMNLLDRYLVMMDGAGIPVSLIFNKSDLATKDQIETLSRTYQNCGFPVYFISTRGQENIGAMIRLMSAKTSVLAGPSGVGKSSLTNLLHPTAQMQTGALSKKIGRGKHTTRHSELFSLTGETYVMDTPGFSSIYTAEIEPNQLKEHFHDFADYEDECKFLGCVHIGETVCGVKTAVADHQISQSRYDNYCLMYQELKEKRKY